MKINDNFLEANENNNMKNIDDDSIETIPINDEKSTVNMSFKNEFNEFLVKNDNFQTEITNQKELKNDVNKYIFINKNNFIYKNNPKISGSSLNIKKKNETNINKDKDVKCSEEKKYLNQQYNINEVEEKEGSTSSGDKNKKDFVFDDAWMRAVLNLDDMNKLESIDLNNLKVKGLNTEAVVKSLKILRKNIFKLSTI